MSVTAQIRVIDVGLVELNDSILPGSVKFLAETQNAVFRDSRSTILSFVEATYPGYVVNPTLVFLENRVDIPEGIDRIRVTSLATDVDLYFIDETAAVIFANHSHAAVENLISTSYTLPGSGLRSFSIANTAPGTVRQVLIHWYSTYLP